LAKKVEKQPREYTKRQLSHAKKAALRQKIYLFGGIAVITAVILLTLSGWIFGEYLPLNKTIAMVYDTPIKEKDLIDSTVAYGKVQENFDITQNLDGILNAMIQNILIRREAAKLGITVSDQELADAVKGTKNTNAYKELVRSSLLTNKLRQDYFGKQIPDSGNQVLMNAMMVESPELVPGIRDRLLSGDNFTALVNEFAVNKASQDNGGVFDWHPAAILYQDLGSTIPVDWAFSENVVKGQISEDLSDNTTSKQLGYWLIKVNQSPGVRADGTTSANVSVLLLSSNAEAIRVKAQLESGADLAAVADKFSQFSPAQQGRGTMIAVESDNISGNFNNYVFGTDTPLGVWSEPIKDTTRYTTKGGDWIVQAVDKSNDRKYSTDDQTSLIDTAYSDWANSLWLASTKDIKSTLDEAARQLAIDRVKSKLK
jgi:parvulin-like peptidyl-prolyl isomerase